MGESPSSEAMHLVDRIATLWNEADRPVELETVLRQFDGAAPRDIADAILVDQVNRWRRGCPCTAEEYFAVCPHVAAEHELRLDIVYGECRIRIKRGDLLAVAGLARRFPDLADELQQQTEVSRWISDTNANVAQTPVVDHPTPGVPSFATECGDTPCDPDAPLSLKDFLLVDRLGTGAMGDVYRAVQKSLNKPVAVKILKSHLCVRNPLPGRDVVTRFLHEARTVAGLRHPHIVGVHGVGRCPGGEYFLVMDLVDGVSLQEHLREGPLPVEQTVRLAREVAEAIAYAQAHHVVHRDLKPSNVLIDSSGRAMVTDFGLAKTLRPDRVDLSLTGDVIGTPQFMAPEQADPRRGPIGPATDVYALGGLCYAMLVGKPPLPGSTSIEALASLLSDAAPVPPRILRPEIPAAVEAVCLKCLRKNAAERYRSAEEVREAFADLDAAPGAAVTVRTCESQGMSACRWRPFAIAWSAGITLAALLVVGLVYHGWPRSSATNDADKQPAQSGTTISDTELETRVMWTIDLYPAGRWGSRIRVTDTPGPLVTGDKVRLTAVFSRPVYAYVFWIGSDGTIAPLVTAAAASAKRVQSIALPANEGDGLPIQGSPGTEVCVLVVRDTPSANALGLATALRPLAPFPQLPRETLVMNSVLFPADPATTPAATDGNRLAPQLLSRLSPATPSRNVGPAEPLQGPSVVEPFARWRQRLPENVGQVHYVAMPHAAGVK